MLFQLIVLLAVLQVIAAGVSAPTSKSVSASLKDTAVDGLGGLNLKVAFPFKVDDYIVGVRHTFSNALSTPEAVFAKKSFDVADGTATVDAEFAPGSNVLSVAAKWVSNKLRVTLGAEGNSQDKLKSVEISSSESIQGSKVCSTVGYDLQSKKISGKAAITKDDTTVKVSYDTESQDPVVEVLHKIDDSNSLNPSVSLKDFSVRYGFIHKWDGGAIDASVYPGDKVSVEWADESKSGVWKTTANVPISDVRGSRVSVSRDWKY